MGTVEAWARVRAFYCMCARVPCKRCYVHICYVHAIQLESTDTIVGMALYNLLRNHLRTLHLQDSKGPAHLYWGIIAISVIHGKDSGRTQYNVVLNIDLLRCHLTEELCLENGLEPPHNSHLVLK